MDGVPCSWIVSGIVGYIVADILVYTPAWSKVNPNIPYTLTSRIILLLISALFGWAAFSIHGIIVIVWTNWKE